MQAQKLWPSASAARFFLSANRHAQTCVAKLWHPLLSSYTLFQELQGYRSVQRSLGLDHVYIYICIYIYIQLHDTKTATHFRCRHLAGPPGLEASHVPNLTDVVDSYGFLRIPMDSYCGWTKSCTALKPRESTDCWYLQGNHHSRVS